MKYVKLQAISLCLVFLAISAVPTVGDSAHALQSTVDPSAGLSSQGGPVAFFPFDGTSDNATVTSVGEIFHGQPSYVKGLDGQALSLRPGGPSPFLTLDSDNVPLTCSEDFSVQFWMRTVQDSGRRFVVLSQKDFPDNSLASQKAAGWVFYVSGGTWAWNMGSGGRRITYERDNGKHMPLNDGRWHQLTMTYRSALAEIRLFYDGRNRAVYHVRDSDGFDFSSPRPVMVGWNGVRSRPHGQILPAIEAGAEQLQDFVDAFNRFGLSKVDNDEFIPLIVDPRKMFDEKVDEMARTRGGDSLAFREAMARVAWEPMAELEAGLMTNPYTVHQVLNFMDTAPLPKVFALIDGEVTILVDGAETFGEKERLDPPDFDMDNLSIWDRALTAEEVLASYSEHFEPVVAGLGEERPSLVAAAWNIWHGGKHFTVGEHGWDSRVAIAEILRREGADVVMMQETYSSGDFIAAELGYYFATTVDWDYLNQGSNISVLSRYPIEELHVQEDSPFMNVGVKVAISRTQDAYVMSNWYGMSQFPAVFDFHESRFMESPVVPTFFAGDFNAVPHTDGGESPASRTLLGAGFTDAFRSLFPDAEEHPGHTHRSGSRIDQLYYKGAGLRNTSTRILSTWPSGFPSDHFLILSKFELDSSTPSLRR